MRQNRFKSKNEAMNRRKSVWVCQACRKWFHVKPAKKQACDSCGYLAYHYFPSLNEARRFGQLCLLLDHGKISDLEVQVSYPVIINDVKIFTYRADFRYINSETGEEVIEDAKPKGFATDLYKLKKKAVEAIYNIKIIEVTA